MFTKVRAALAAVALAALAVSSGASTAVAAPRPTLTDLALGKPYTVSSPITDPLFHYDETTAWPNTGQLTDGQYGTTTLTHAWVGFLRQETRTVTVDLGQVDTVRRLTADFLQEVASGITVPQVVRFEVSLTGQSGSWSDVGTVRSPVSPSSPVSQSVLFAVGGPAGSLNLRARFVRVEFPVAVWVFCDEVQVLGTPGVQPGSRTPVPAPAQPSPAPAYAAPGTAGIHHAVLAYLGYLPYPQSEYHWQLTAQQWLPYVAYVDPTGAIRNWFFDTVVAEPNVYWGTPVSSTANLADIAPGSTQADWQWWLANLFDLAAAPGTPQIQLPALNKAVGEAKAALGDPSYRENVVITLPYPYPGVTDWGSLTPHGPSLSLSSLSHRIAAESWFVNAALADWQAAHLTNLHLVGFNWIAEQVDPNPGESTLIRAVAHVIHLARRSFIWIPFFEAQGYQNWRALGFDLALLQPNYAEALLPPWYGRIPSRLTEAAELAQHWGTGLEMELLSDTPTDPTNPYIGYLDAGVRYGAMTGSALAFYQGTQVLLDDFLVSRYAYNLTYAFVTGTYTPQDSSLDASLGPLQPLDIPRGLLTSSCLGFLPASPSPACPPQAAR